MWSIWGYIGFGLLAIGLANICARHQLFGAQRIEKLIEDWFFNGESIYAENFRYAREVTWLGIPAIIVGVVELLPFGGNLTHFLELAIPFGWYMYVRRRDEITAA